MEHKTYNWKVGYWAFNSFLTNSSIRMSYSVTKSTGLFFSITPLEEAKWMADDPAMIRTPALRASLIVKSRIALRSAGVSFEVDMVYRFSCVLPFYSITIGGQWKGRLDPERLLSSEQRFHLFVSGLHLVAYKNKQLLPNLSGSAGFG